MLSARRTQALGVIIATAIGLLSGLQFWLNAYVERADAMPLFEVLVRHSLSWSTWGLVAPLILRATRRWPLRGTRVRRHLAYLLAFGLLFALVHRPLHVWFAWYPFWGNGPAWDFVRDFAFFSLFTDFAIFWLLVGGTTVFDQRRLIQERDLRASKLSGELVRAKLALLEQQLRPHFLFNTLHAIQVLQQDDRVEEAGVALEHLSEFLRAALQRGTPAEHSLREELELAQPYLALMQVRYGDRLRVTTEVDSASADCLVPRLILQPLLENSFLHGIDGRRDAGRIQIRAVARDDTLTIAIRDDGPGPHMSGRRGGGLGLENVRNRLEASYGERASFELEPVGGGGTVATLRLPARRQIGKLEGVA